MMYRLLNAGLMLAVLMGCTSSAGSPATSNNTSKASEAEDAGIQILVDAGGEGLTPVRPMEPGEGVPPPPREELTEQEKRWWKTFVREREEARASMTSPEEKALAEAMLASTPDHWTQMMLKIGPTESSGGALHALWFLLYNLDEPAEVAEVSAALKQAAIEHLRSNPNANPFEGAHIELVLMKNGRWRILTSLPQRR